MSKEGKGGIALNYGVLLGIISVLSVVLQYVFGTYNVSGGDGNSWIISLASFVLGVVIIVLAVNKIKKSNGGYISFKEAFKGGFTVYIISALFVAGWMLIYTYVLEPGYQDEIINQSVQQMEEQGGVSEEQMETAISWTRKFTSPLMLSLFSILGAAFFGGIISAIIAAILKNNKPMFEYESQDGDNA